MDAMPVGRLFVRLKSIVADKEYVDDIVYCPYFEPKNLPVEIQIS